jgi:hypothetical protein
VRSLVINSNLAQFKAQTAIHHDLQTNRDEWRGAILPHNGATKSNLAAGIRR